MKPLFRPAIIAILTLWLLPAAAAPKLVVYLIYDQLRADLLTTHKSQFLPAQGTKIGGFNYLTENGSYFPFGEYDVLSTMTCPGHAIISTGSWPIHTGISINAWYSRSKSKKEYCVDDDEFGVSPRKLKTTTISDEFKASDKKSKVYGIALKDRSAVMLAGHKADAAYWFDEKAWQWRSSAYYSSGHLKWISKFNTKITPTKPDKELLKTAWGVQRTTQLAEELITKENLGRGGGTDFLFISYSSHDIAGHQFGPNSPELKQLLIDEDKELSRFLNALKTKFNLEKDVWIVLTGDHGIPPTIEYSSANKISAQYISEIQMIEKIYKQLNEFYKRSDRNEWFKVSEIMHYTVNKDLLEKLKIERTSFLKKVREIIMSMDIAEEVILPELYSKDMLMSPRIKRQIENSFVGDQWGDIILMPKPFSIPSENGGKINHVTGYSYDKMVPMIFVGAPFKKQTFYTKAYVVDIHPTIAALLGIVPSPKVDGRILHEIIK